MALSSAKQLARLHAREQDAKRKLEAQRKTLQAVQLQQRHEQRKLALAHQRELGRLAYDAGLGTVDLETLRMAFARLALDLGVGESLGVTTRETPRDSEGSEHAPYTNSLVRSTSGC
jgi:hypothetical protein